MKIENKVFITLTIFTAFITAFAEGMFSDSFLINFLIIPIWIFGCFLLSGTVFIIPYFLIGHFSNYISDLLKTVSNKNKKIIYLVSSIVFWILLTSIVTYIK